MSKAITFNAPTELGIEVCMGSPFIKPKRQERLLDALGLRLQLISKSQLQDDSSLVFERARNVSMTLLHLAS